MHKIADFEAIIRDEHLVSGKTLHKFGMIYPERGCPNIHTTYIIARSFLTKKIVKFCSTCICTVQLYEYQQEYIVRVSHSNSSGEHDNSIFLFS